MTPSLEQQRELDASIAETWFGYRRVPCPPDANGEHGGSDLLVPAGRLPWDRNEFGSQCTLPPKGGIGLAYFCPTYSRDLQRVQELEGVIKARGLAGAYIVALAEILGIGTESIDQLTGSLLRLMQSTPYERCLAAMDVAARHLVTDLPKAKEVSR